MAVPSAGIASLGAASTLEDPYSFHADMGFDAFGSAGAAISPPPRLGAAAAAAIPPGMPPAAFDVPPPLLHPTWPPLGVQGHLHSSAGQVGDVGPPDLQRQQGGARTESAAEGQQGRPKGPERVAEPGPRSAEQQLGRYGLAAGADAAALGEGAGEPL